jgi:hypothetical protein
MLHDWSVLDPRGLTIAKHCATAVLRVARIVVGRSIANDGSVLFLFPYCGIAGRRQVTGVSLGGLQANRIRHSGSRSVALAGQSGGLPGFPWAV